MLDLDVLVVSDFRLLGGTNRSTAQELEVHRLAGLRTGLVQSNSRLIGRAMPWSSAILEQVDGDLIRPILPGQQIQAKLALLRHPSTLEAMRDLSDVAHIARALIIANHAAVQPNGSAEYDVAAIDQIVTTRLGVRPAWAPIGPVVRESLAAAHDSIALESEDWTNIFASSSSPEPRWGFDMRRPRIGRHSRPQAVKWPSTADEIRCAYPTTEEFDVRILGGADPAKALLGGIPERWTIHAFGSMPAMEFLGGVDFWVYFHDPGMTEAYGRAVMEALWSGAVVILPEYLRETYGEAALYGTPTDVQRIVREFQSGTRSYVQQSRLGQRFAERHSPEVHLARIRRLLNEPNTRSSQKIAPGSSPQLEALRPPRVNLSTSPLVSIDRFQSDERPRALFITSNGAGMGHLTRMLGIARAATGVVEPIFFSMSQGVSVVASAGMPYEYVPFTTALKTKPGLWHRYFEDRLSAAIERYGAKIVLFDGTWPYAGLLSALAKHDVLKVWVRRGMWKPNISPEQLEKAARFDLVIEPGEHAADYDTGATSMVRNAEPVPPITVLSQHEVLSRESALAELGLPHDDGTKYALVTLGAGNINDVSVTQSAFLNAIRQQPGWEAVLTRAPIAAANLRTTARTVSVFPLARYTKAFDFAVSAAGYNSFSEWMSGALPAIWVPNLHTMTDDQDARARWAHDSALGLRVTSDDEHEIRTAVALMCDDQWRLEAAARLRSLSNTNGATVAAEMIGGAWSQRLRRAGV